MNTLQNHYNMGIIWSKRIQGGSTEDCGYLPSMPKTACCWFCAQGVFMWSSGPHWSVWFVKVQLFSTPSFWILYNRKMLSRLCYSYVFVSCAYVTYHFSVWLRVDELASVSNDVLLFVLAPVRGQSWRVSCVKFTMACYLFVEHLPTWHSMRWHSMVRLSVYRRPYPLTSLVIGKASVGLQIHGTVAILVSYGCY